MEAARAAGARSLQVQRWGVLPQVLPEIVAFWLYRFEINIRAAAVLGVVGAGGVGFVLQQTITFGRYPQAGTTHPGGHRRDAPRRLALGLGPRGASSRADPSVRPDEDALIREVPTEARAGAES